MKITKLFILLIVASLFIWLPSKNIKAQETNDNELLAEFEADDITAKSLGVEDPLILPGDKNYWWTNLKRNINIFFTFDEAKKTEKELELANTKLLEVKKLVELNRADSDDFTKTLEKYKATMEKVANRLYRKDNEEKLQNILSRLDRDSLQHQQLLMDITSKVNKNTAEMLDDAGEQAVLYWYKINPNNIKEKLDNAVEQNNSGSDFKQLRNLASLEKIKEILPQDLVETIEEAQDNAIQKLHLKIRNADKEENNKMEKYLENINLHEINYQRLLDYLGNANLPDTTLQKIQEVKENNLERLREHFQNLTEEEKNKFLEKFQLGGDASYLEILKTIKDNVSAGIETKIQSLNEQQQMMLKERIQATTDENKLKILEQNIDNDPVLQREIQERKYQIRAENIKQNRVRDNSLNYVQ